MTINRENLGDAQAELKARMEQLKRLSPGEQARLRRQQVGKSFSSTLPKRLTDNVVERRNGCIEWIGTRDRDGYGRIRYKQRPYLVHRFTYFLAHAEIPAGLNINHHCDNRPCCNPDHLYAGTQAENMRDRDCRRGRRSQRSPKAEIKRLRAIPDRCDCFLGNCDHEEYLECFEHIRELIRSAPGGGGGMSPHEEPAG